MEWCYVRLHDLARVEYKSHRHIGNVQLASDIRVDACIDNAMRNTAIGLSYKGRDGFMELRTFSRAALNRFANQKPTPIDSCQNQIVCNVGNCIQVQVAKWRWPSGGGGGGGVCRVGV
jgi:hypothetical protein